MDNRTIKVINGFTHKYYTHVVDNAQFYQTIVAGDKASYGSLVVNYKPRETNAQKIQRVEITQNRTKKVAGKIEGFFKRVFRPDKIAFEVSHEDKAKAALIAPYVDKYGNDGQSLLVWSEESALFYNDIDPNAFYWVKHSRVDGVDTFAPFIFKSSEVKDYSIDKGEVQYAVCELQERVDYMQDTKQASKTIQIIYNFTIQGLEITIELDRDILTNSSYYDKFLSDDGELLGETINLNNKQYLVLFEENEIDAIPISRMGYMHDKQTEKSTYVPFWDNATEEYKILVNDGSVFDVSKALHGFPMKFIYYVPCNYQEVQSAAYCRQGVMHPTGKSCHVCSGTGKIVHISAQDVIEIQLPTEEHPQTVKPADMAAYVKQPFEALDMQKELVQEATATICEAVFGVDLSYQQGNNATATQVSNYYDTAQDALYEFSKSPRRLFIFTVQMMAKYLDIMDIKVALIYSNEYNLASENTLLMNLKTAKDADAPAVVVDSITNKIIIKQNRNNSSFLALHKALTRFKPFGDVAKELVNNVVLALPDSSIQKALFLNFKEIVADVQQNDKTFLLKSFEQQKRVLNDKAAIFAAQAVAANSVREIVGLGMADNDDSNNPLEE